MMHRITFTFLGFLALATVSAGITYQNGISLVSGRGNVWSALILVVSAVLLGFAMLVLGRILYLTAPKANRSEDAK